MAPDGTLRALAWDRDTGWFSTGIRDDLWQVRLADHSIGGVTLYSIDAVPAGDAWHVCAQKSGAGLLHFTNATGVWVETVVDGGSNEMGLNCRIKLDSAGKRHIVYWDPVNQVSRYATDKSGAWVIDVPDSKTAPKGGTVDLSVRADGTVDVLYKSSGLRHATNAAGAWVVEIVDADSGAGKWPSVLEAPNGDLHAVYVSSGKLRYARRVGTQWSVQTAVETQVGDERTSLAMDAAGKLHAIYATPNRQVKYLTDRFGAWSILSLHSLGGAGQEDLAQANGIAVDAEGAVHHISRRGWGGKVHVRLTYTNLVDDNCDGD